MTAIKSFTSLEQSKKLAEILPIESADMWWVALNWQETEYYVEVKQDGISQPKKAVPCWSLAALLELMPDVIHIDSDNDGYLRLNKTSVWYIDDYKDVPVSFNSKLLDAIFQMICWLKENNKL